MSKPALLLLPNLLAEGLAIEMFLPASVAQAVATLDGLIAESEGGGRRYLKKFQTKKQAHLIPIALLNEHTPITDLDFLLEPIVQGERWGLLSDAGLPCIADPGSCLVWRARERGIAIEAFSGPSSLTHALILSGLPSQKFFFHGYLDKDPLKKKQNLLSLIQQAAKEGATQAFIETPYRNQELMTLLINTLPNEAYLTIAWDLTLPTQGVVSGPIPRWKKMTPPSLDKKPAFFLFSMVPPIP